MENRSLNPRTALIIFLIIGIILSIILNWNWLLDLLYVVGGAISFWILSQINSQND